MVEFLVSLKILKIISNAYNSKKKTFKSKINILKTFSFFLFNSNQSSLLKMLKCKKYFGAKILEGEYVSIFRIT